MTKPIILNLLRMFLLTDIIKCFTIALYHTIAPCPISSVTTDPIHDKVNFFNRYVRWPRRTVAELLAETGAVALVLAEAVAMGV